MALRLGDRFSGAVPAWTLVSLVAASASLPVAQLVAQVRTNGPVHLAVAEHPVRLAYTANESGGRVTLVYNGSDPSAVESIRLRLLESVAAIRRGDFRLVSVLGSDSTAIQVLTDLRLQLRCSFRAVPRGGELVLMSDDDAAVAAIHQLLQARARPDRD